MRCVQFASMSARTVGRDAITAFIANVWGNGSNEGILPVLIAKVSVLVQSILSAANVSLISWLMDVEILSRRKILQSLHLKYFFVATADPHHLLLYLPYLWIFRIIFLESFAWTSSIRPTLFSSLSRWKNQPRTYWSMWESFLGRSTLLCSLL